MIGIFTKAFEESLAFLSDSCATFQFLALFLCFAIYNLFLMIINGCDAHKCTLCATYCCKIN